MKSEKGVTLISLTVYVIVLTIVIGILALTTNFFYGNIKEATSDIDPIAEFTKFNSYFTEETNKEGIQILECEDNYVLFSNGVQYTYENNSVYRDKAKICKLVDSCTFKQELKNGKKVITVNFKAGTQNRKISYTLKD